MQPTVLFIDDEPRILRAMQRLLRPHSKVLIAESGLEALELLCLERVDVIVCDQRMPNMSGTEVLTEARRLSPRSMRILLTGYTDLDAAVNALNQGHIYRYLNKPWTNEELIETILEAARISMATPRLNAAQEAADEITAEKNSPSLFLKDSARREVGVLVVDSGADLEDTIKPLIQAGIRNHRAQNVETALIMLEQQSIGVALINAILTGDQTKDFVQQIRQHHPNVMSIVISKEADIAHLASLINAGSIYRFLPHPLDAQLIQASVKAALARHMHQRSRKHHVSKAEPSKGPIRPTASKDPIDQDHNWNRRPKASANADLLYSNAAKQSWFSRFLSLFRASA